jgi:uncharacterized protein YpmB
MTAKRANASVFAMLIILMVIAGVIYLFWQSAQMETNGTTETVIENTSDDVIETETDMDTETPESSPETE